MFETKRLILILLTFELTASLENTILPNGTDKTKNYLYSALSTAISIANNEMVGAPNAKSEIQIDYGTYQEFHGK